jgi:hypothetical protein
MVLIIDDRAGLAVIRPHFVRGCGNDDRKKG